jgi:hypothetical protein
MVNWGAGKLRNGTKDDGIPVIWRLVIHIAGCIDNM